MVQYFGENPKQSQPNTIFPVLQRFVDAFRVRIESHISSTVELLHSGHLGTKIRVLIRGVSSFCGLINIGRT